jgi:hypothetical protein
VQEEMRMVYAHKDVMQEDHAENDKFCRHYFNKPEPHPHNDVEDHPQYQKAQVPNPDTRVKEDGESSHS